MTTSERWIAAIDDACAEPDAACSNRRITRLHYLLSEALAKALGREGGPNFHSWAVWGSRKAGVTIRQEDLDSAIDNATVTAAIVGSAVGAAAGVLAGRLLRRVPSAITTALGVGIGTLVGASTGKRLAIWSRGEAAKLMLEGNQIVIQEVGEQTARFLELLENGASREERAAFFAGLRPGPTETHGQDRLSKAFGLYLNAYDTYDLEAKHELMIGGNCEIVYHEHIRLEPYIRSAMPFIIRRCATQRLMTYDIGETVLTVGADLPGVSSPTAARNWTRIEQRMRYVFALFRKFHQAPEVFSTPFSETEMARLAELGPSER